MYGYVRSKRKVKKALGVARLAALWRDQRLGLLFVFVFCFVLFFLGGGPLKSCGGGGGMGRRERERRKRKKRCVWREKGGYSRCTGLPEVILDVVV